MHIHTVRTKFTFGDRIRFDSKHQRCSGTGTILDITFDGDGYLAYTIHVGDGDLQAGIEEDAIAVMTDDASDTPAVV